MSPKPERASARTMLHTDSQLTQRLQERLQPTLLEVLDESADHAGHAGANAAGRGTHFRVRIASPLFTNLSRVAKHRLVYDALQEFIDQGVHAIAIETL
jgi:BolA family transcriptional regulator, general stress-responsive regulator